MTALKLDPNVRAALQAVVANDNSIALTGQLDRITYQAVDKVLKVMGGRWDRRSRAHVFARDPRPALAKALAGTLVDGKKAHQQFFTPPEVVDRLLSMLGPLRGLRVLEPSAGAGAIALAARALGADVACCEVDPVLCDQLRQLGFRVHQGDFLMATPEQLGGPFDAVVMNPPFTRDQDVVHVMHAWSTVRPGGLLGAVVSPGYEFKRSKAAQRFREVHGQVGEYEGDLAAGAFKASGTVVRTKLVVWRKPANDNGTDPCSAASDMRMI